MHAQSHLARTNTTESSNRIVFLQYGNYADTVDRFANGEPESYYAQRYSVDFTAGLLDIAESVTVVCLNSEPYERMLPNGVCGLGLRVWQPGGMARLFNFLRHTQPTHAVVVTPMTKLLRWCARNGIRVLPMLADSFPQGGSRTRLRYWWLAHTLNRNVFPWIGNHNVNSARDLARIGVDPAKIIPWDWPPQVTPDNYRAKESPAPPPFRAIYVGHLSKAKGLTDALAAVASLGGSDTAPHLTVLAGKTPSEEYLKLVREYGVSERVHFYTERLPHRDVVALMHEHDAVLVPSRHEYPEGLPMTIYDAFCARTPLIASDHPMFAGKIAHEKNALVFRAGDPASLAEAIRRLQVDTELFRALSEGSRQAWLDLQCPVKWGDLITRWLRATPEDDAWLGSHTLASGTYD